MFNLCKLPTSTFSCQTVNVLTNEILWTSLSSQLNKAIDNVIVKNKLKSVFLCVCPLTDDKFRYIIVKVYCGTPAARGSIQPL